MGAHGNRAPSPNFNKNDINRQSMGGGEILRMILNDSKMLLE